MFKEGQKVLCVDGKSFSLISGELFKGVIYTIDSCAYDNIDNTWYVQLKEFPAVPLWANRFQSVDNDFNPIHNKIKQMYERQESVKERKQA